MKIASQVYVKGSAEAVVLYQNAFGVTLGYHVLNAEGSYFHAELLSDGAFFLAVSEAASGSAEGFVPPMQFCIEFKDAAGVARAFDILKPGADVTLPVGNLPWSDCCASLVDRFGVNWYLSIPQHKPEE